MDRLVAELLAYGRLSRAELELETVATGIVVRSVVAAAESAIRRTGASIETGAHWPKARAHPSALEQVLGNLLDNALKFVKPGVPPRVSIRAESRPPFVRISVADEGIGVAPEDHARIFDLFVGLHAGERYPGTGVGLALVKRAMERMSGAAGVDSEPGKGSVFWVDLPASDEGAS